ncbi:signal recognition particle receptor subunit beta [Sitodiplosis mosellana]|uniref:signal recognition particle receptor subunit beta n=1 Tax=Sitodiplosis mosellana TaxID=263140 RepID=UPI002443E8A0|nr:signal recognition particle receptor subunit beta [Sitodiplosis mosellana]
MEHTKPIRNAKPTVSVKPTIKLSELNLTPVYIALFVVLISIVLFFLWKKKSQKRTDLLLTGLCESGKTLLFSQLVHNTASETFTSIAENVGEYVAEGSGKSLRVIDIPGHERLRGRFFDQYKNTAKGIVFLVDSVTVQKDIRDVADYLYTVLADPSVAFVPVLITCNKQDETFAKGSSVVKPLLEKELNLVRNTRQNQLQSVDNSTSDVVFLGKQGKDFEFVHLSQSVEVIECSGRENDVKSLKRWLKSLN